MTNCFAYEDKVNVLYLLVIYVISQWMLLVVTGRWWDDWILFNVSDQNIFDTFSQAGDPFHIIYYIHYFLNCYPHELYRILTFLLFAVCMLCYYFSFRMFNISSKSSFYITLIAISLPHNDARIMQICFPYTLCFFLFSVAVILFLYCYINKYNNFIVRIIILLLFFISFTTNSLVFLYGILLLYIIYDKVYNEKNKKALLNYMDFFLNPFIFIVIKFVFYHPYGLYSEYNAISLFSILKGILYSCLGTISIFIKIIDMWVGHNVYGSLMLLCVLLYCLKKKYNSISDIKKIENIKYIGIGFFMTMVSMWPYCMIRGWNISIIGSAGRDSILVYFGMPILIYGLLTFVLNEKTIKYGLIFITFSGILNFYQLYATYQAIYYQNISLEQELKMQERIKEYSTIIWIAGNQYLFDVNRFYSLNGHAEMAYNNTCRFIGTYGEYGLILDEKKSKLLVENEGYHMGEYNLASKDVEAFIRIDCNLDIKDIAKLKFYEYIDGDRFKEYLSSHTNTYIIDRNNIGFERLLENEIKK